VRRGWFVVGGGGGGGGGGGAPPPPPPPPGWVFAVHFGVVWVAVWLVANGPMRVPFLRWRFRGGRLV
jgi:hypothetical protein